MRFLAGKNLFDRLRRDRLDVGAAGEFRIGHDGRRIRVDEDYLVTLFGKGLASLHPGVIKFATLTDHNGARAD